MKRRENLFIAILMIIVIYVVGYFIQKPIERYKYIGPQGQCAIDYPGDCNICQCYDYTTN